MKGQMFIITMIFLVGMIFTVQASLAAYGYLDLSRTLDRSDLPLLTSTKHSYRSVLEAAPTCEVARDWLQQLQNTAGNRVTGGVAITTTQSLDCPTAMINLTIRLKSIDTETIETAVLRSSRGKFGPDQVGSTQQVG